MIDENEFRNYFIMLYNEIEDLKNILCHARQEIQVYQQNNPKTVGKMLAVAENSIRLMKKCDKYFSSRRKISEK